MISCRNIEFHYRSSAVLRDFSLSIQDGERIVVLGRSGCGKTTLLKLLAGILRPTCGEVVRDGPVDNFYAFSFQSPVFFPWLTVEENVVKVCELNGVVSDARQFLQPFGLIEAVEKYPWQLSGGMQRRLSIAMALSLQRPLLLLDEPGGGLDDWTKETLLNVLETTLEIRKTTCVATTHNLFEAVFLADRIILMGQSPTRVLLELEVKLPRPRLQNGRAYGRLSREVERLRETLNAYREET